MIIRHFDAKNGDCFFYGDDVQIKTVLIEKDCFEKYQKDLKEETLEKGEFLLGEKIEILSSEILDITGWNYFGVHPQFFVNTPLFVNTSLEACLEPNQLIVILLQTPKTARILCFNEKVYLMSDEGKTIEKILG